jgi:hypothetical protein
MQKLNFLFSLLSLGSFLTACSLTPANQDRLTALLNAAAATPTPQPTATPNLSVTLIPDGSVQGNAYYYSFCIGSFSIGPSMPTPGAGVIGGSELEFSPSDYSSLASGTAPNAIHECFANSANTELIEVSWNVSSATASNYSSLTVNWSGLTGVYSGTCSESPPTSLFTPLTIQLFDGVMWNDLTTTPDYVFTSVSQNFSSPANYVFGGQIWIRIRSEGHTSSCATVQTQSVSLTLEP